jgi:hypothetical protein
MSSSPPARTTTSWNPSPSAPGPGRCRSIRSSRQRPGMGRRQHALRQGRRRHQLLLRRPPDQDDRLPGAREQRLLPDQHDHLERGANRTEIDVTLVHGRGRDRLRLHLDDRRQRRHRPEEHHDPRGHRRRLGLRLERRQRLRGGDRGGSPVGRPEDLRRRPRHRDRHRPVHRRPGGGLEGHRLRRRQDPGLPVRRHLRQRREGRRPGLGQLGHGVELRRRAEPLPRARRTGRSPPRSSATP